MNKISVIGLDLAKNVFQVHGIDSEGEVAVRKQLKRSQATSAKRPSASIAGKSSAQTSVNSTAPCGPHSTAARPVWTRKFGL